MTIAAFIAMVVKSRSNQSSHDLPLSVRWRVEVRILVRYPGKEPGHARIGAKTGKALAEKRKLGVGKGPVQGPMADRVNGYGGSSAAAFWNRVVIFYVAAEEPATKPTIDVSVVEHLRGYIRAR